MRRASRPESLKAPGVISGVSSVIDMGTSESWGFAMAPPGMANITAPRAARTAKTHRI